MATESLSAAFGHRIRQLREAKAWSQEDLASAAGLHRTHISLIENAKREVQLDTVDKLAVALGVSARDLFSPAAGAAPPAAPPAAELDRLMPYVREYQALAVRHGIDDVFQDNGGKLLQTLILLDLKKLPRREGNDAVDGDGNEYELKTVNLRLTKSFSTHHHLNPAVLRKYRTVGAWYFSLYEHIELVRIYRLEPGRLEPFFAKWEAKWQTAGDLNNPKIPVSFVEQNGQLVYPLPG